MSSKRTSVTHREFIPGASSADLWPLVSDTNRWDRALGMTSGNYEWGEEHGLRVRKAFARELGFEIAWIEPPYQWVEGRFVEGERIFLQGPVERGGLRVDLEERAEGTEVSATAWVAASGARGALVAGIVRRRFERGLRRYVQAVRKSLSGEPTDLEAEEPNFNPVVSGTASETNRTELRLRAERLRRRLPHVPEVERLIALLEKHPDEEVAQIRPLVVADGWGADRAVVLRVFLHATRAGLVDLLWQVNCPVCRVAADHESSLERVGRQVHCDACNIAYDIDFGRHVEAVFRCHPAIRTVKTAVYCASSPYFRPHVLAQLILEPNQSMELPSGLSANNLLLRTLGTAPSTTVELGGQQGGSLDVQVDEGSIAASAVDSSPSTIRLESYRPKPSVVVIEKNAWDAYAATGAMLASFSDFIDLFAAEAPATGADLSISEFAVLFTDLTGSTALYEQIGDARAFSVVQAHFKTMAATVERHHGAVVKTIGDAVMAVFSSVSDAVGAALAMVDATEREHGDLGIGLKVGVHSGPCLMVRANERIDFFGTTVNLAARLQGTAAAQTIVCSEDVLEHPDVQAQLEPFEIEPMKVSLKGLRDQRQVVCIRRRPA